MKRNILKFLSIVCLSVSGSAVAANAHTLRPLAVPVSWKTLGGQYPDQSDPTRLLPRIDQLAFACIRFHESRNHLKDGLGSQGWYQFTLGTWQSARSALPALHLPVYPNQASGDQQSAAAVWYFKRNGRFGVQWAADAGECPGRF